jgi:hypothetical protein
VIKPQPQQDELFPGATKPLPKAAATGIGHRKFLSGGEWEVCGHKKADHAVPGQPNWDFKSFELSEVAGEQQAYFVLSRPVRESVRYVAAPHCWLCSCPKFQAREFKNPFLGQDAEKVSRYTMCGSCRHAKMDHHRTGCAGVVEQDGSTPKCNCQKFVNPFAKPRTQGTQPELIP